jgi:hypothetical protein
MPINLQSEQLVSYHDVVSRVIPGREGKRVHVGTLHRWRTHGLRGIRLESIKVGGRWHTSLEGLERFFNALTFSAQPNWDGPVGEAAVEAKSISLETLKGEGF